MLLDLRGPDCGGCSWYLRSSVGYLEETGGGRKIRSPRIREGGIESGSC